jgi:hypothetical protein
LHYFTQFTQFCEKLPLAKNILNTVRDVLHADASLRPPFTFNTFLNFQDAEDFSEDVHHILQNLDLTQNSRLRKDDPKEVAHKESTIRRNRIKF